MLPPNLWGQVLKVPPVLITPSGLSGNQVLRIHSPCTSCLLCWVYDAGGAGSDDPERRLARTAKKSSSLGKLPKLPEDICDFGKVRRVTILRSGRPTLDHPQPYLLVFTPPCWGLFLTTHACNCIGAGVGHCAVVAGPAPRSNTLSINERGGGGRHNRATSTVGASTANRGHQHVLHTRRSPTKPTWISALRSGVEEASRMANTWARSSRPMLVPGAAQGRGKAVRVGLTWTGGRQEVTGGKADSHLHQGTKHGPGDWNSA